MPHVSRVSNESVTSRQASGTCSSILATINTVPAELCVSRQSLVLRKLLSMTQGLYTYNMLSQCC